MPSRRSHTNSHHGCMQCKAKRVKCDEKQPSCSRCTRRQENCTYRHLLTEHNPFRFSPYQFIVSPGGSTHRNRSPKLTSPVSNPSPVTVESFLTLDDLPQSPRSVGSVRLQPRTPPRSSHGKSRSLPLERITRLIEPSKSDLVLARTPLSPSDEMLETSVLFHHYSTVISRRNPNRYCFENFHLWDAVVKRHATSQSYLLNAVCAISAFHLATHASMPHLRHKYTVLGLAHQTRAVEEFRPSLGNLTKENCEAAFTTGAMLVSSRFAKSIAESESAATFSVGPGEGVAPQEILRADQDIIGELQQIMGLCRGVFLVYNVGWSTGMDNTVAPIFRKDFEVLATTIKHHLEAEAQRKQLQEEIRQRSLDPESPLSSLADDGFKMPDPTPDAPAGPEPLPSDLSLIHFVRTRVNKLNCDDANPRRYMYFHTAYALRIQIRLIDKDPNLHRVVTALPSTLPPLLLEDVANHDPHAFVLLAHYAVIVAGMTELWWTAGWGRRLLSVVRRALERRDREEIRSGIQVPTGEMGEVGDWVMCIEWPIWKITGKRAWESKTEGVNESAGEILSQRMGLEVETAGISPALLELERSPRVIEITS